MTEGTWNTRDLPLLRAVVDTYEGWGRYLNSRHSHRAAHRARSWHGQMGPQTAQFTTFVFREVGQNIGRADDGGSAGGGL